MDKQTKQQQMEVRNNDWYYFRFQSQVMKDQNLNTYDKAVYGAIVMHADLQDQTCFPSFNRIAKLASCSRRKAIDSVKALVAAGYISKTVRKDEENGNKSNLYEIVDLSYISNLQNNYQDNEKILKAINDRLNEHPIPDYDQLLEIVFEAKNASENNGENDDKQASAQHSPGGSARDSLGGSAQRAPGVVNDVHQASAQCAPELESLNYNHFNNIEREKELAELHQEILGKPIETEHLKFLDEKLADLSLEIIVKAYKEAGLRGGQSFGYIITLLNDWANRGLLSLKQVQDYLNNNSSSNDRTSTNKGDRGDSGANSGGYDEEELEEICRSIIK